MVSSNKIITFFMLVTNRDIYIADYSIASYLKIYKEKNKYGGENFTLFIYLNNVSPKNKEKYLYKWQSYPFVKIYDNSEKLSTLNPKPFAGQIIISPEGIKKERDDYAENYDELWTWELSKFKTDYIATVDADFEILNADFYNHLMEKLSKNNNIIAASSCFSTTQKVFDTYSKREVVLFERNHTWFCIYRKEAFSKSNISHFYYEEIDKEGNIIAFDSAAYFQQDLKKKFGYTFHSASESFKSSFVHYAASSKNRSLNSENIAKYRRIFLLANIGLIYRNIKNKSIQYMINKLTKKITKFCYKNYLSALDSERKTYIFK